jgi:hypothetical protein
MYSNSGPKTTKSAFCCCALRGANIPRLLGHDFWNPIGIAEKPRNSRRFSRIRRARQSA